MKEQWIYLCAYLVLYLWLDFLNSFILLKAKNFKSLFILENYFLKILYINILHDYNYICPGSYSTIKYYHSEKYLLVWLVINTFSCFNFHLFKSIEAEHLSGLSPVLHLIT